MKPQPKESSEKGFSVHDALYIVFKHKWKIIMLSMLGFSVAGFMAYQVLRRPSYESMAKLMVRYVVERAAVDSEADDRMMTGGMLAEMEILTSRDTAIEVAEAIGPANLLPDAATPPTASEAAEEIKTGLKVESPGLASNMLYLTYRSSDFKLTSKVLSELIQIYFRKHLELHRSTETFTQVSRQTDEARSKLRLTEGEINQLKDKFGVLTIGATMEEFETRKQTNRENLMTLEAQLAEQRAKVSWLKKSQAPEAQAKVAAASPAGEVVAGGPGGAGDAEAKRKRSLALAECSNLAQRLLLLQQRRNELLILRKPGDPMVSALDRQISQAQKRGLDLIEEYPDFAGKSSSGQSGTLTAPVLSLEDEMAIESAIEARLNTTKAQAKELDTEVARISGLGFQLQDLERRRQMEEEKYRYFQSSLEKARLDETLDPSKIPNISVVQTPSPPEKSIDKKSLKLILGIASSGIVAGLALAFLMEMVVDRRVSRPIEIQTRLQLPLMMSIPYVRSKDNIGKLIESKLALPAGSGDSPQAPVSKNHRRGHADQSGEHFITPYVAAMHDRIIFNFQINDITHKPKLVALTGLSEGAGTTTIAAGLAKAFADNGDRKVLLVNLNAEMHDLLEPHSTSLFRALEDSKSERFRTTSKNLYFANASTRRDERQSHALAPMDLHRIMPHLVGSDYDYIIFDMPPIGPTSPTLTMAGFMDKVLLVLDGGNTTRENLSWAYAELEKARADVSCVFNKARSHAPQWVQGDV